MLIPFISARPQGVVFRVYIFGNKDTFYFPCLSSIVIFIAYDIILVQIGTRLNFDNP